MVWGVAEPTLNVLGVLILLLLLLKVLSKIVNCKIMKKKPYHLALWRRVLGVLDVLDVLGVLVLLLLLLKVV